MNWNKWIRQTHRWLSIAFTVAVIVNGLAVARGRYSSRMGSNVESTFSMMKRKFGDSLRSKTDVAMVNETLCKILYHNLVVLIHEMCELGIDPVFWPNSASRA